MKEPQKSAPLRYELRYDPTLDAQLPSHQVMMTRLAELEKSWETRLNNMKQVIANLDADRARLSARIQRLTVLLESVDDGHYRGEIQTALTEEW